MRVGDLVRVFNIWIKPGESDLAVYLSDHPVVDAFSMECTILWNGSIVSTTHENLQIVSEHEGG